MSTTPISYASLENVMQDVEACVRLEACLRHIAELLLGDKEKNLWTYDSYDYPDAAGLPFYVNYSYSDGDTRSVSIPQHYLLLDDASVRRFNDDAKEAARIKAEADAAVARRKEAEKAVDMSTWNIRGLLYGLDPVAAQLMRQRLQDLLNNTTPNPKG